MRRRGRFQPKQHLGLLLTRAEPGTSRVALGELGPRSGSDAWIVSSSPGQPGRSVESFAGDSTAVLAHYAYWTSPHSVILGRARSWSPPIFVTWRQSRRPWTMSMPPFTWLASP